MAKVSFLPFAVWRNVMFNLSKMTLDLCFTTQLISAISFWNEICTFKFPRIHTPASLSPCSPALHFARTPVLQSFIA